MRPKMAMWSDYGSPTQKRWRSRYRRSTRSSTGLKILLGAVAGVIGISGVYPQIIDSEWARGTSAHSQGIAHSETAPVSVGLTQVPQPPSPAKPAWVAQLIGDNSETAALSRFHQMQGLCLAATSLLFFEQQSNQVQRPYGFVFASNLTHAKVPTRSAPN
jgi:hypothetical protein